MRSAGLLLVALVCGAGCVDSEQPLVEIVDAGEEAQVVTNAQGEEVELVEADICEVLPADGPCSAACDRETLLDWVPVGTCALFQCDLTDGREVAVHACHPAD